MAKRKSEKLVFGSKCKKFVFGPRCTIARGWNYPSEGSCGELAVSRNGWGGFQCKFHDTLKSYSGKPVGPLDPIKGDTLYGKLKLWYAYIVRKLEDL